MTPSRPPPRPDPGWAFFLDADGTLLEIASHPDEVRVEPHLLETLDRLSRQGAVALVSGRLINDLDRLFQPLRLPAAGAHGLERRRADGRPVELAPDPALDELRRAFADIAAARSGVWLEDKRLSLALHYRQAPEYQDELVELARRLVAPHRDRLTMIEGKMAIEIKPRGIDKGTAIAAFMSEPPFAGRRPAFLGDDTTDEDGFAAAERLGGLSVVVGARSPSSARCRLLSVTAVHEWLAEATT